MCKGHLVSYVLKNYLQKLRQIHFFMYDELALGHNMTQSVNCVV